MEKKLKKVVTIGIAGPSASGKSSLANSIVQEFSTQQVVVISEDSYYKDQSHLPMEEREKTNYDHPNAFDHELLTKHLDDLCNNKAVKVPVYDHSLHTRGKEFGYVEPSQIVVLEGILLFSEERLRKLMDIKIYVDAPLDLCILRRLERDVTVRGRSVESVISQYQETVRPMFLEFVEPSKKYADLIVPIGGKNKVAIGVIKARLKDILSKDVL